MNIRSFWIAAFVLGLAPLASGCASMIAKMATSIATSKTTDVSGAAIQSRYITNFYPIEADTQEMRLLSPKWKTGDNSVTVNLLKRDGTGFLEVDGSVTIDGQPALYTSAGIYTQPFSGAADKPKSVRIATSGGQVVEFQVPAPKPLKLVSVNGAADAANIDLTKDLTLEFDKSTVKGGQIRVALITKTLGMRNFAEIGIFNLDKTVKVPAAAFKHPLVHGSSNVKIGAGERKKKLLFQEQNSIIIPGANFLLVERFEAKAPKVAGTGAIETISQGWAWMPVTVSGEIPTVPFIETLGELPKEQSTIEYYSYKPNASIGKPLAEAKKIAITSLVLRGLLIKETESNTKKKTYEFPKVPVGHWDNILESFYEGIADALKDEFGSSVLPLDKVINAPAYQELDEVKAEYTKGSISRSYKGLRSLDPTSRASKTAFGVFPSDKHELRLMRELGVDALVEVMIHFGLQEEETLTTLTRIDFRIIGGPNGYANMTTYAEGQVVDYVGKNFSAGQFKDADSLKTVIPHKDLIAAFRQALKEQEAKAKELGYHEIWALQ